MLFEDDIYRLFKKETNHEAFLKCYAGIANDLMHENEEFIREASEYLKAKIVEYSKLSAVYRRHTGIITKNDLKNKSDWYASGYNMFENETSGSTGAPFKYGIWSDVYDKIECESHYKTISDEFGISGPTNILYLQLDVTNPNTTELVKVYTTQNPLISHGLRGQARIHSVIANRDFYLNYYKYYEDLIEYAILNRIDIIHAQNNAIESLAWNMKRLNRKEKLCKLISNTGSKLNLRSVIELQQNGNIDAWCDHMRCWDGGVTFFTCKYNTYHLLDSLAWAYSEDYKLISYDYFSLPSPFVNYWNGDYAEISNQYERCKCGRAFRRFEIGRTRSKISQVAESSEVQSALADGGLLEGIKRVEITQKFMRVFTKYSLHSDQRKSIRAALPSVEIQFTVEEDIWTTA